MIPASYLSPEAAQGILDTLTQGQGTDQGSNNTYTVLPSLAGGLMTTQLTDRILDANLSTVTTISTAGLTAAEVEALTGIRTRVVAGLATAYEDYPKQNPLNDHNTGAPVTQPEQDHRVDVIIQTILFWDPRYFLRLRSNVGTDAENTAYELPSRYNYLTNPMIIATMRLHGFTSNVANVGPGTSTVTSTVPHGFYSGMTIEDTATFSATTWTANITQTDAVPGANIASVDSYWTTNAAPTFSTGNDINISVASTTWTAVNNLGAAHVDVTGNQIRFYRDVARTDQILASWGTTASTDWQGINTANERVAVNTAGQHLIIPDAPLQFNYTSGSAASSIYELKYISNYNPVTQRFTSNVSGFSIADGQLVNMAQTGTDTQWANPLSDATPHYFKRTDATSYQVYRTENLAAGNVWAFGNTTTISNIAYSAGNTVWQVNFDSTVDYPPLISGQDIRFLNTSGATDFSAAVNLSANSAAGNITLPTDNYWIDSALGQVGGRDRLVAVTATATAGQKVIAFTDDGQRWTQATTVPDTAMRSIIWVPTVGRWFALTANTNRIWTSTDGNTWTNAHAAVGTVNYNHMTSLDLGTQTAIYSVPDNMGSDVAPASATAYVYSNTTGAFVTTSVFDLQPPDGDTWEVRDVFENYMLIRNTSTGSLRVTTTVAGAVSYAIGATTTTTNTTRLYVRATSLQVIVTLPTQTRRRARTSLGGTWAATTHTTPAPRPRIVNDYFYLPILAGTYVLITPLGQATTLTETFNGNNIPLMAQGYISNRYVYTSRATGDYELGFYKQADIAGTLLNSYNDRYTATGHPFTTGQQIRSSATFVFAGTAVVPPADLWIEVVDANSIDLFENEARTIGYNSGRPSGAMTSSTITPVFYVKYRSARTWDLYLGSDITDANARFSDNASMTGGTTTGSTRWNGYLTSIASATDVFIRPMFYPQYHSSTRVSLWTNAAKTVPYNWFGRNGTLQNQQTAYTTTGLYFLNNIGHLIGFGSDTVRDEVVGINSTPLYYAQVVNDYVINLYADAALTVPYTQPTWANSAATAWQTNPSYAGAWRLDNFYVPNIGTKTYFTTNLTTSTTTVNASWALTDSKFYSRFNQTQSVNTEPAVLVNEHAFANAGAYYGQMRYTDTTGSGGPGNVAVVSGTTYGGFGSGPTPVFYSLNDPGRFNTNAPILFGIDAAPDTGTAPVVDEALAYTGAEWATASNLTDRELRRWPSTIAPSSMTWTIEQPNSTLESYNLTRYSRARDVTQYRMRLTYPPMTKSQVAEFTNVIHAARGSFKPMVFVPPVNSITQQYVTIKVGDKNVQVPAVFRARDNNASGTQVLQVDGLPPSLTIADPAFDAGWAVELPIRNSTGSWGIPIHDVLTNAYGEANMRLNNNIASAIDFGAAIGADAAELDVFIDADSVELKVDTIGLHYLEIDLVTKRIF